MSKAAVTAPTKSTKRIPVDVHQVRMPRDWTAQAKRMAKARKQLIVEFIRDVLRPILEGRIEIVRDEQGEILWFRDHGKPTVILSDKHRPGRPRWSLNQMSRQKSRRPTTTRKENGHAVSQPKRAGSNSHRKRRRHRGKDRRKNGAHRD